MCFHLYYLHLCISLCTCANVICIKLLLTLKKAIRIDLLTLRLKNVQKFKPYRAYIQVKIL